jgi:hypothetical protein
MFSVLEMNGAPVEFTKWTRVVVQGGKVCVNVNDKLGLYFKQIGLLLVCYLSQLLKSCLLKYKEGMIMIYFKA